MNGGFQPIAFDPAFQQEAGSAFQCLAFQPFAYQNDCEIPPTPTPSGGGGGGGWYGKPSWKKKRFHQQLNEWFTVEEVKEKYEVLLERPDTRQQAIKLRPYVSDERVEKQAVKEILALYKQVLDLAEQVEKNRLARIRADDDDVILGIF